jgi:hypothetical protein
MVFGRKQEASDEGTEPLKHPKPPLPPVDGMFRQVTDMAWDQAGNTYISDGYINSRVAKVDKNGNWIKSWGEPGDKPGQFSVPHSIAVDAKGNVYVADRGNRRIQVFDGDGNFSARSPLMCLSIPMLVRRLGPSRVQSRFRQRNDEGRIPLGPLHHARTEPGALQLRCLSRPDLQAESRR